MTIVNYICWVILTLSKLLITIYIGGGNLKEFKNGERLWVKKHSVWV